MLEPCCQIKYMLIFIMLNLSVDWEKSIMLRELCAKKSITIVLSKFIDRCHTTCLLLFWS